MSSYLPFNVTKSSSHKFNMSDSTNQPMNKIPKWKKLVSVEICLGLSCFKTCLHERKLMHTLVEQMKPWPFVSCLSILVCNFESLSFYLVSAIYIKSEIPQRRSNQNNTTSFFFRLKNISRKCYSNKLQNTLRNHYKIHSHKNFKLCLLCLGQTLIFILLIFIWTDCFHS